MQKKYIYIATIITVLLFGFFVRFWQIGTIPGSLYWDEVAMLLDAQSIAKTGADMHGNHWASSLFPSYGDYKLPVYILSVAAMIPLFGDGEWIVRVPSALAGILTMGVSGMLAWMLCKNKIVTVATVLVVATSPWSIVFSRTAFESHLAQALLGISIAAVFAMSLWQQKKLSKNKRSIYWVGAVYLLSILLGALATYTYFSVRFVWPIAWAGAIIVHTIVIQKSTLHKKTIGMIALQIIGGIGIYSLLLMPMYQSPLYQISTDFRLTAPSILNSFDHAVDSNVLREYSLTVDSKNADDSSLLSRVWYHRHWLLLRSFFTNLSSQMDLSFWFIYGDNNLRHGTGMHGLFALPLLIPTVFGLYKLASLNKNRIVLVWLVAWIGAALVPAAVPMEVPHALRSLNALIPVSIIIGLGIHSILPHKKTSFVLACTWVFFFIHFWMYYTGPYRELSAEYWQAGYSEQAKQLVLQAAQNPNQEIEVTHSDDRFFLWILLQPEITPSEIQSMPMEQYQPTSIRNIIIRK